LSFLILDIETVPRASIDEEMELDIAKRTKARVERTGDVPGVEGYVIRDVEATYQLYEKIKQYIS